MPTFDNLEGKRFGRLIAKSPIRDNNKNIKWICICDCGNICTPYAFSLKNGRTQSCGCFGKEQRVKANTKHNMTNLRIYSCWEHMKDRCNNKNFKQYKDYGGRGISVCEEWYNFENFYNWSMENGYNDNLTLDRIDVNGNYCPENCRWATRREQQLNKRNNVFLTMNGITMAQKEWAKKLGIRDHVIIDRLKRGWTVEEALTIPTSNHKKIETIRKESTTKPASDISSQTDSTN